MESRNPVFSRRGAFGQHQQPGRAPSTQHLEDMYNQPAYEPPTQTTERRMTIDDVVVRGFMTLGTLVVVAAASWVLDLPVGLAFVGMIGGLVLGLIISFKQSTNPALVLAFAACYGLAVGVISHAYNDLYNGIVLQAVLGTALAFASMLIAYTLRIIRVTPKFTKFVIAAGMGLFGLMIVNLLASLFIPGGIGIRTDSPLGWIFSIAAILVGCFFLLLDFAMIEDGVQQGAPERFAWLCAFGITLTLVWIYLEILRLLSYLQGD